MSHKLFHRSNLSNARVWDFLKQVDAAEAEACREAGCPRCGGTLHSATYPRKPYGLAAELRDDVRRFSLCCSVCRRRVKPASVRFFGRRFYVGALFLLVSALALAGGVRLQTIARRWGVPTSTLRRWRRWWLETFPLSPQWAAKRGELATPPGGAPLRRLLRLMRGRGLRARLLRSLVWLMPWTGFCALGAGPASPAESVSVMNG
ncbi:MAG: helix-turn-helix domain-containing protein [Rhodospirillaceae bacterium]|nr:helix-turn-helix domain-containing protein [Holophagales bacterium]MYJ70692.1 helix-turn-helix domain-containing protein [Rhodospirillaceae bacterium]